MDFFVECYFSNGDIRLAMISQCRAPSQRSATSVGASDPSKRGLCNCVKLATNAPLETAKQRVLSHGSLRRMLAAEKRASELERQVQAAKERARAAKEQRKKTKRHLRIV